MDGFFPIFFLMVILKIPVGLMLYLVWWAVRASAQPEEAPPEPGEQRFDQFRRRPRRPRGPRRGDHGPGALPLPACPPARRSRVYGPPAPVRAAGSRAAERS